MVQTQFLLAQHWFTRFLLLAHYYMLSIQFSVRKATEKKQKQNQKTCNVADNSMLNYLRSFTWIRPWVSVQYISINTACAAEIHSLIQVQQVGVESDDKPLIPYDIIIILSAGRVINNHFYLNRSPTKYVALVSVLICHPVLFTECFGWRISVSPRSVSSLLHP